MTDLVRRDVCFRMMFEQITTADALRDKCDETYQRIQEWRDAPDAFDVETDRGYVHDLVQGLQDDARKMGCAANSIHDPSTDQALNVVAEIIAWCESQDSRANDALPTPATIRDWYTPNELAELIGKSPFTVREKWCNESRIECEKDLDNNKWRIPGREVKRLLNGGKISAKQGR